MNSIFKQLDRPYTAPLFDFLYLIYKILFSNNTKIIFIEGNISSGKSTFIKKLKDYINDCDIVLEPLDEWEKCTDSNNKNILTHFYNNMEKYAYSFQSLALVTRMDRICNINMKKKYVFIERSIFSDKHIFAQNCFDNKILTEIEWNIYNKWFDWMTNFIMNRYKNNKIGFIFLECDPKICYKRMTEYRQRSSEKNVPLEYLEQIDQKHHEWFNHISKYSKLKLNTNQAFKDDPYIMKKLANQVLEFSKII